MKIVTGREVGLSVYGTDEDYVIERTTQELDRLRDEGYLINGVGFGPTKDGFFGTIYVEGGLEPGTRIL